MNFFKRWKEQWLVRNEQSIRDEYRNRLSLIQDQLESEESILIRRREEVKSYSIDLDNRLKSLKDSILDVENKTNESSRVLREIKNQHDIQENKMKFEYEEKFKTLELELLKIERSIPEKSSALEIRNNQVKLEQEQADELFRRVLDRKVELLRVNDELKQQIRLIEAKASPDNIWVAAFSSGFQKAWETMHPILMDGFRKASDSIRDEAINDTISNLDPIIKKRAQELNGNLLSSDKSKPR